MKDTGVAFLATAAAVAPICALCVLGPTAVFSWLGGWLAGLDPLAATGLAIIAASLVYSLQKRRHAGCQVRENGSATADDELKQR